MSWNTDDTEAFLSRACDADATPGTGRVSALRPAVERWKRLNLAEGDLVLLALPNGVDLLDHWFAVQEAGGVPALVPPGQAGRLTELVTVLKPRAVLTATAAGRLPLDRVEPFLSLWVSITDPVPPATQSGEIVLLTSGTSGVASACVFDREQLSDNAARHVRSIGQRAGDTVSIHLPLYFSFALVAQALGTMGAGGRLIVGSSPFHAPTFRRVVAEHGVTVTSLTPVLIRALQARGEPWPEGLRVLTVGGDAIAPEAVTRLLAARPGRELYLTYGLTQAGPRVSTLAAHAEPQDRYASVGRPFPEVGVELRDPDPATGAGELLLRSDSAMKRRLGLVEGRAADWARPAVLATQDVFRIEDGYLYFQGRLSDWVTVRGEKVSLTSVRRVAGLLPGAVTAQTVRANDGYDLHIGFSGDPPSEAEARAALRVRLRPGELPRVLRLFAQSDTPTSHK
jgi:long-chain acyl-CoA synthetase